MSLTTGILAKRAGVGIQTIRFYEREGLMEPAPRSRSGYRHYDESAVTRLTFIRRAQELGFTLKEIRELIALDSDPDGPCDSVSSAATAKLAAIEGKIADLTRMKDALVKLISSCVQSVPIRDCAVIECLRSSGIQGGSVENL